MWNQSAWNTVAWNSVPSSTVVSLDLEESLCKRVQDHTGYACYPGRRPQGKPLPCFTYQLISRPHWQGLQGSMGVAEAEVQIDAWGLTYRDTVVLSAALRNCLHGFGPGNLCANGVYCLEAYPDRALNLTEPYGASADRWLYHRVNPYQVTYTLPVAANTSASFGDTTAESVEIGLRSYLLTQVDCPITYQHRRQGDDTLPALVLTTEGEDAETILEGASGVVETSVKVSSIGANKADVVALDESVRVALDGYTGMMVGVNVLSCLLDDGGNAYVQAADASDKGLWRVDTYYTISWTEQKPTDLS